MKENKKPKNRNPVVAFSRRSGSIPHGKTRKALRAAEKVSLKKEMVS